MCGRYFLTAPGEVLAELFELDEKPPIKPRYNIAPTQEVAIVSSRPEGGRDLTFVRWGLVPHWAKESSIGDRMINARGETLAEKPAFREPFKRHRCLIPASGFFEWQKVGATKQPWAVRLRGGAPMALAGLWSRWLDPKSREPLDSMAIVTTGANPLLVPIHDRMPVILPPESWALWIDAGIRERDRLTPLLTPLDPGAMEAFPVSRRVNNPANDDRACLDPTTR